MTEPFPYDMRAVLQAAGKGLSPKKIVAAAGFVLIGYLLYVAITYLALMFDDVRFDYIWQSYGLFPVKVYAYDSTIALLIQLCGVALGFLGLSQGILAVAVINFEEVRGNHFFSLFDAIRFTVLRTPTLLLGFISLGAFIGFVWLLGFLVGLLARVPVAGEAIIGLLYLVPIFITLLLTLFVVFASIIAVILLPVVIAAEREKELFGPLLNLFSVLIKEPIRFFWYLAVSMVMAKVSSFVLAYVFYRTVQFSRIVLKTGGGEKIDRMFNAALNMLPLDSSAADFVFSLFPGISFGFSVSRFGYGGDQSAGAVLLAISLFILFILIIGYMLSVIATGMSRGYVVIRRMKDDYFMADEAPMNDHSDYANPPFSKEVES
ncbi:MAG: hypothetical protein R3F48_14675 [Candidatus Zixiibacteriota bacterium]